MRNLSRLLEMFHVWVYVVITQVYIYVYEIYIEKFRLSLLYLNK